MLCNILCAIPEQNSRGVKGFPEQDTNKNQTSVIISTQNKRNKLSYTKASNGTSRGKSFLLHPIVRNHKGGKLTCRLSLAMHMIQSPSTDDERNPKQNPCFNRRNQAVFLVVLVVVAVAVALGVVFAGRSNGSSSSNEAVPIPTPTPTTVPGPCISDCWLEVGSDLVSTSDSAEFSTSVASSSNGTIIAVGALATEANSLGNVRVYVVTEQGLIRRGSAIEAQTPGDNFGASVAMSGDGTVLAVGADESNSTNGVNSGSVFVYAWNGTDWNPKGSKIDGAAVNVDFGYSVSLSSDGNTIAIGSPQFDGFGPNSGRVQVLQWHASTDQWVKQGDYLEGQSSFGEFGWSLSLSADASFLAVGERFNNNHNGAQTGSVRVFGWNSTSWVQVGSDLDGISDGGEFGYSVSLSSDGSVVAIGARLHNVNDVTVRAGLCQIYELKGAEWTKRGQDIVGANAYDNLGHTVALSGSGDTLVVGSIGHRDASGQVRAFQYSASSSEWIPKGYNINGETTGARFGWSIALSENGSTLVVGPWKQSDNLVVYNFV